MSSNVITSTGPLRQALSFHWQTISQVMVCGLFGHQMENNRARVPGSARICRCGANFLPENAGETRVRHILSCFFMGHKYVKAGVRDGINEYLCEQCGHPLLFSADQDRYAGLDRFLKGVRYLCSLFGHRVRVVGEREGLAEYICHCGHSFLRPKRNRTKVTHPLTCFFAGHFVRFTERRGAYSEYLCRNCGHTFYLW